MAAAPKQESVQVKAAMDLCRHAAMRAADAHGVPREVMLAITLVETRTRRKGESGPWPWTVNVAGKGTWFSSRAAALLHAQHALAGGQSSFDVGCFQLNYRWHGSAFTSIDEMFEPAPSGDYAAKFLKSLYAETGDWMKASGLYHSRTAKHAKRYRALVAKAVARMGGKPMVDPPVLVTAPSVPLRRDAGALIARRTAGSIAAPTSAGAVALVILRRSGGGLFDRKPAGGGG